MAVAVAELVMVGGWIGLMVNVSDCVPVPKALTAERVIVIVPVVVGVPEISPVSKSKLKPAGRSAAAKRVGVLMAVMM